MDISKNITSIREAKGLKQYEVAERLGIEPPNYSRLEKRGDKLTIEQLKAIADAIGVSFTDFFGIPNFESKEKESSQKAEDLKRWLEDKEEINKNLRFVLGYAELAINNALYDFYWGFMESNGLMNKVKVKSKIYNIKSDDELSELFDNNKDASFYLSKEDNEKLIEAVNNSQTLTALLAPLIAYCHFKNKVNFWTKNFPTKDFIATNVIKDKYVSESYILGEVDLLVGNLEKFRLTKKDLPYIKWD